MGEYERCSLLATSVLPISEYDDVGAVFLCGSKDGRLTDLAPLSRQAQRPFGR